MFAFAPLIGMMPQATLAAVVIVYSVGLVQPRELLDVLRIRRLEFTWALAALAGVMALGTLRGILVAVILSVVALAHQTTRAPVHVLGRKPGTNVFRPRSAEHPEDETFPGLLLLRLEGRVFFLNAGLIAESLRSLVADARPKVVALDLGGVPDLEYTALRMLVEGERRQGEAGVALWLVGLNPGVYEVVRRSPLGERLGRERMFFNLEAAVEAYRARARG
jgi:MFS superfamily sulfate permease-like transporter